MCGTTRIGESAEKFLNSKSFSKVSRSTLLYVHRFRKSSISRITKDLTKVLSEEYEIYAI